MFIPGIGFLRKNIYPENPNIGRIFGGSNRTGFRLTVVKSNGEIALFRTRNYCSAVKNGYISLLPVTSRVIVSVWILTIALFASFLFPLITHIHQLFFAVPLGILAVIWVFRFIACSVVVFERLLPQAQEENEWHGLEHKTYFLLSTISPMTVDNLKKSSKTLMTCGSMSEFVEMETIVVIILFFVFSYMDGSAVLDQFFAQVWLFLLLGNVCCMHSQRLQKRIDRSHYSFPLYALFFPGITLGLFFQWLCLVREPSEEKLHETLQDLRQFCLNYHIV